MVMQRTNNQISKGEGMVTLTQESPTTETQETSKDLIIDVRNLVKRFPVGDGEVTILKNISFQVKQGEFLSIVGPSGSGKSTIPVDDMSLLARVAW